MRIACEYWKRNDINASCDDDDVVAVTRLINGGTNGLGDRSALTTAAKAIVARLEAIAIYSHSAPSQGRPVLRRGSKGAWVGQLQWFLRDAGFMLAVDNDFGPATELAVMSFQSDEGLELIDGIVGSITWGALDEFESRQS